MIETLYGPNHDSPEFYTDQVFKKVEEWAPEYSIFAGDYNVVLDQAKDTKNYLHINNPNASNALKDQISQLNLVDVWREMHPDDRTFTWTKFNGKKQSRLDFFLISSSLMPFVQSSSIIPGFCSDHSAIQLDIDFSKFSRGRGFWKFNASLLGDHKFRDLIKTTVKRVTAQYGIISGDENFYVNASKEELGEFYSTSPEALQHIPLKINHQSFLDVLLLEIRRETMIYSARKKRDRIALCHLSRALQ